MTLSVPEEPEVKEETRHEKNHWRGADPGGGPLRPALPAAAGPGRGPGGHRSGGDHPSRQRPHPARPGERRPDHGDGPERIPLGRGGRRDARLLLPGGFEGPGRGRPYIRPAPGPHQQPPRRRPVHRLHLLPGLDRQGGRPEQLGGQRRLLCQQDHHRRGGDRQPGDPLRWPAHRRRVPLLLRGHHPGRRGGLGQQRALSPKRGLPRGGGRAQLPDGGHHDRPGVSGGLPGCPRRRRPGGGPRCLDQ